MDCPNCGRRRLEYGVNAEGGVIYVECEKCGANSDDETWCGAPVRPFCWLRLRHHRFTPSGRLYHSTWGGTRSELVCEECGHCTWPPC